MLRVRTELRTAAFLVLLSAAARTGIVATHFVSADYLLHVFHLTGTCHAGLVQFATLFALELFLELIE